MKLAIIISVSSYNGPISSLPACSTDAQAMSLVLGAESGYEDVLRLDRSETASLVKTHLSDFVVKHKEDDIDQVVFYFSGHGDFTGEEFYYLLSDYDPRKRNQTSLDNSEVDHMLRTLSPKVTAKIVDACHSGVTYVKDAPSLESFVKGTKAQFDKCYFLFSSSSEQSSYQDCNLSFFTRSILEAIAQYPEPEVRFKDVIDFVSDAFANNELQKPLFVAQADFTEHFCRISDEQRTKLSKKLEALNSDAMLNTDIEEEAEDSLLKIVENDANRYCSRNEMQELFLRILERSRDAPVPKTLNKIYSKELTAENDMADIPKGFAIGQWIAANKTDVFATPTYSKRMVKKKRKANSMNLSSFTFPPQDYEEVEVIEEFIDGFAVSVVLPFVFLSLYAKPKYPNLRCHQLLSVFIVSKVSLYLFQTQLEYSDVNWDEIKPITDVKWHVTSIPVNKQDDVINLVIRLEMSFWEAVEKNVRTQLTPGVSKPSIPEPGPE